MCFFHSDNQCFGAIPLTSRLQLAMAHSDHSQVSLFATEETRLLDGEIANHDPQDGTVAKELRPVFQKTYEALNTWYPVLVCCLLFFVVDFASFVRVTPKTRMFEIAFCREYYLKTDPSKIDLDGNVAESFCKVADVQEKLALLKGWLGSLECIPGTCVPTRS